MLQSIGFQRVRQDEATTTNATWEALECWTHGGSSALQFSSDLSLSHVRLFVTPWTAACQASLSITNSWSLLKLMSIELVIPPNHLVLCCRLFLLPLIFPSIRVFSNESVLHSSWSFSFSISPSNEYSGLISFRIGLAGSSCSPRDSQESSPTPQFKSINFSALSLLHSPTLTSNHVSIEPKVSRC